MSEIKSPASLKVLILEDNLADAELLLYQLQADGYQIDFERVDTKKGYLDALDNGHFDIILADFSLPQFDAIQALRLLQEKELDLPFIVVTGTISEEVAVECMRQGASDYLLKDRLGRLGQAVQHALDEKKLRDEQRRARLALEASEDKFSKAFHLSPDAITINRLQDGVYLEVNGGFERLTGYSAKDVVGRPFAEYNLWLDKEKFQQFMDSLLMQDAVYNMEASFLRADGGVIYGLVSARTLYLNGEKCVLMLVRDVTERIKTEKALAQAHQELESAYDATIEGWSLALELRDQETEGHTRRVTKLSLRFGRRLGLSESELKQLRRGVLLHDIGKMAIPDSILRKPGPLTPDEWEVMKMHPVYAYQMLANIAYLRPALVVPYYHHERWDGSGYPHGLSGTDIPLMARLFAIVDVWDSMCYDRVYRKGLPIDEVLNYLRENAGKLFDPDLVSIFIEMIEESRLAGDRLCA